MNREKKEKMKCEWEKNVRGVIIGDERERKV